MALRMDRYAIPAVPLRAAAASLAVCIAICGCSSSSSPTAGSHPARSASSAAAPASAAATFSPLTAACPLLPVTTIEQVSGLSGLTPQEIPTSPGSPAQTLLGCEWDSGGQAVAAITVDIQPATSGESAQQYLSSAISGSSYNFGLSQDVPGLGGAAEFGTAQATAGLSGSVWYVVLRGGDVAQVTVSCLDTSGAEDPIVAMARQLYGEL